jgi:hypothetical protein
VLPSWSERSTVHSRSRRGENPTNRFEHTAYERDAEWNEPDDPAPKTQSYRDASASIITHNDSPDIGFESSINPYRGYEYGCTCHYAAESGRRVEVGGSTWLSNSRGDACEFLFRFRTVCKER